MRGGISGIADLLVSPLSPKEVALGMLFGQGFPVVIGGLGYFGLGVMLLAITEPVSSRDPEKYLLVGVILMFAGPLLIELFVEGFKAGMRREGFALSAVTSYLITIATYCVFPLAARFASEHARFGYRQGIESEREIFFSITTLAFLFALLRAYYCWRNLLKTTDELAKACEAYWESGDAS